MRKAFVGTIIAAACLISGSAAARDPVGEKANYKMVRDSSRTSPIFTSGRFSDEVQELVTAPESAPYYKVLVAFRVSTLLGSTYDNSFVLKVPPEYFEDTFLERLRGGEEYVGPNYKARHTGYADVVDRHGTRYPQCDKVLLTQIQTSPSMRPALSHMAAPLENVEILMHLAPGIPAMGAVRVDLTAVQSGARYRLGFDYEPGIGVDEQ